jgi:hypothetical protein
MCGGPSAHHQAEQAKRDAAAAADQFARQLKAQQEQQKALLETMKPTAPTPPPVSSKAQLGSIGVKAKKSKKASTLGSTKSMAQLRIPLNVGGAGSSGTNIPT